MSTGWIKLHRKLTDNPLWKSETFARGQAWVDLILLANHEDGYIYVRGHKIKVKRGQVGWSQNRLAERWGWSRSKVRKFLQDLEEEQQIKQVKSHSSTVITLINYNDYQAKKQQQNNRKQPDSGKNGETPQIDEQQKNGSHSSQPQLFEGDQESEEQQKDNRKTIEEQQQDTNKNVKNVKKSGPPAREEVEDYFRERGTMLEEDIPLEAEKFINYYDENNWKNSSGKKITNWHRQAGTWQANYQQYNKERIQEAKKNNDNSTSHIKTV